MAKYLNENIKYLRMLKKMSQQGLADKIGIDRSTISRIENNEIETTVDNAIKIAEVLDVPLPDLLGKDLRLNKDNTQKATFENNEMKVTIWKDGEITNDDLDEAMAFILEQKKKKKENDKENEKR